MNGTAIDQPELDAHSRSRVRFGARIIPYGGIWLAAAFANSLLADGDFTGYERFIGALLTPVAAVFGLAMALTGRPTEISDLPIWPVALAAGLFGVHAVITLTRTRPTSLAVMLGIQVVLLSVAAIYLVRLSKLPSGG